MKNGCGRRRRIELVLQRGELCLHLFDLGFQSRCAESIRNGYVQAIKTCRKLFEFAANDVWQSIGWRVDSSYRELTKPISIPAVVNQLERSSRPPTMVLSRPNCPP